MKITNILYLLFYLKCDLSKKLSLFCYMFKFKYLEMPLHFFLESVLFFPYLSNRNCQVKKNETKKHVGWGGV
jgi:hypothetical protein